MLTVDPNNADALYNKGLALYSLGHSNESIGYFDRILIIYPNNAFALGNKGLALNSLGQSNESIGYFDKMLTIIQIMLMHCIIKD